MDENCKMIGGYEFAEIEGDAHVGNMYASTRIGKVRENQEDAVLIMQHPEIDDFKMMVVADGMGGRGNGEIASSIIVKEMKKWFEELNVNYYSNPDVIEKGWGYIIKDISKMVYQETKGGGSTLVAAITCKDKTVIANVGDSRAYKFENQRLEQITEDDSPVYHLWKKGKIKEKDDMRFHKRSNIIERYMGMDDIVPLITGIERSIPVILCSDGVTDCLSDDQISATILDTDVKELARALVNKALSTESKARKGLRTGFWGAYCNLIPAGKDNATVAVLITNMFTMRYSVQNVQLMDLYVHQGRHISSSKDYLNKIGQKIVTESTEGLIQESDSSLDSDERDDEDLG